MSYALELPDDVKRSIAGLPIPLQEEVFDALEKLTDAPWPQIATQSRTERVFDFILQDGNVKHYIFLVASEDRDSRIIRVRAIGHVARPA